MANAGIELIFVTADGKTKLTGNGIKDATNMKFAVDNSVASEAFEVDTEYFAKVTFTTTVDSKESELNSIVVPFQFAIPDFANSFEQEPAVFIDNVANAYMTDKDQKAGEAAYSLWRAFKGYLKGAKLTLDDKTKIVGDLTSAKLATFDGTKVIESTTSSYYVFDENAKIVLNDTDKDKTTGLQKGYKQNLIVNASADDYMGWAYPEGEGTYTFTIKVMSPLYEGTVTAVEGVVSIDATSTTGERITNDDIKGYTYNNIAYNVLQDKVGGWNRPEVDDVKVEDDYNKRVLQDVKVIDATAGEKGAINQGYIRVLPQNIATTTETTINVTVVDIWGYTKTNPIKVEVKVGE